MIDYSRRHLALVWFWLLLAALPRALLPAGTMPEFHDGGIQLSYCISDDSSRWLKSLGDPPSQTAPHASCPYALTQAPIPPSTRHFALGSRASPIAWPRPSLPPARAQRPPRPPSQAPPSESGLSLC